MNVYNYKKNVTSNEIIASWFIILLWKMLSCSTKNSISLVLFLNRIIKKSIIVVRLFNRNIKHIVDFFKKSKKKSLAVLGK